MPVRINPKNVTEVFTEWTTAEHARLHGPGDSVLTNLVAMRVASAHEFRDFRNIPVNKTSQHIDRMRQRVNGMYNAGFSAEYTGRALSDCLKLFAGQQIKRLLAAATNQADFASLVRQSDLGVGFTIKSVMDKEMPSGNSLREETELLQTRLNGSLSQIAERAIIGEDWGREHSPMVTAAWLGEAACARMAIATINYVALNVEGIQNVPLRKPASDAEPSVICFPFRP